MKLKNTLMMLALNMAFFTSSFAATVTWDGDAGDNNWMSPMNWDTDAIPTAADEVDLNNATVVLGANTTVQRVLASGGSVDFTINAGVTLTITGLAGDDGLDIDDSTGSVTNNGTIAISNISGSSADGLYSKGIFTNTAMGTVSIDGTGEYNIYVQGGNFTNDGTITLTNFGQTTSTRDGIILDDNGGSPATLTNNGTITITMTGGDDGIYLNDGSTFTNTSMITIGGASGDNGIRVDDGSTFNNNNGATFTINATPDDQLLLDNDGIFNNMGTVHLNNSVDVGLYVTDASTFNNAATGQVNVTDATDHGVYVQGNTAATATINNSGTMTVNGGGGSSDGVRLNTGGSFTNNAGATLNLDSTTGDDAIEMDNPSVFDNSGTINVLNSTDSGIDNEGDFNNMAGAILNIDGVEGHQVLLTGTATFDNAGMLDLDDGLDNGLNITISSSFTNTSTGMVNISGIMGADNYGIQVDGNDMASPASLDNSGTITVSNVSDDALRIRRAGTMTNNASATVTVTNAGKDGIQINTNSSLINGGSISVDGAGSNGIFPQGGTFTNTGVVTIANFGQTATDQDGLAIDDESGTAGTLNNNGGSITVTMTSGDDGVYVNDGSTLNNNAMLTIDATGGGDMPLHIVDVFSILSNGVSGNLSINGGTNYAIQIDGDNDLADAATLDNSGTITVSNTSEDALRIRRRGTMTNNVDATFTINSAGRDGIQIDSNSSLTNGGTISIDGTVEEALELNSTASTFNNLANGTYMVVNCGDDGIQINSGAVLNNDGAIRIDGSTGEDIETFAGFTFNNTANATFAPGSSPGDLITKGDWDLGTSTTTFEINGTTPETEYDQIIPGNSSNTLTISGATATLDWGVFVPTVGDIFTIVDGSGPIGGEFATVNNSNPNIVYMEDYTSNVNEVRIVITAILPVELVYFNGEKSDRGSELVWETATEINNEGFEIERSTDNERWTTIGYVNGNGNSNTAIQYDFLDNAPATGTNYYRLKQNDFDGQFEYSRVVALDFNNGKVDVTAYPNPVKEVLYLDLNQDLENVEIQIQDVNGKVLWMQQGVVTEIPFGAYSPGVYFLNIVSASGQTVQLIVHD